MKIKRTYLIAYAFACIALFAMNAVCAEPPPPHQVFESVTNHWVQVEINQLDGYIVDLYTAHSNYVPAILAASFRDHIYLGKLSDATNKLFAVQQLVNSDKDKFDKSFKDLLSELLSNLASEIKMHARHDTTPAMLESNADAQTVRDTWDTTIMPGMSLLFYAPATNIVNQ